MWWFRLRRFLFLFIIGWSCKYNVKTKSKRIKKLGVGKGWIRIGVYSQRSLDLAKTRRVLIRLGMLSSRMPSSPPSVRRGVFFFHSSDLKPNSNPWTQTQKSKDQLSNPTTKKKKILTRRVRVESEGASDWGLRVREWETGYARCVWPTIGLLECGPFNSQREICTAHMRFKLGFWNVTC